MIPRRVVIVLFIAMIAKCGAASAQDAANRLAALDYDYRTKLEDLLRTATQQDEKAVVAAIKARLAVVTPKPASGQPIQPAQLGQGKKTLSITATMVDAAELYCSKDGIQWKDSLNGVVDNITVNGVQWVPRFGGGAYGKFTSDDVLQMNVGTVLRWKTSGKVSSQKIYRGPGVVSFLIGKKDDRSRRTTFTLEIEYQPAPGVEVPKQEAGKWQE